MWGHSELPPERSHLLEGSQEAVLLARRRRAQLFELAAERRARGKSTSDQDIPNEIFVLRPPCPAAPSLVLIGGMGPLAGLSGFERACQRFGDHRTIVLVQACTVADRTRVVQHADGAQDLVDAIARAVIEGARYTTGAADVLVLCNTAHGFLPAIAEVVQLRDAALARRLAWGSLVDAVVRELARKRRSPVLLATTGARVSGVYARALAAASVAFSEPDDELQALLMRGIYNGVKAFDPEEGRAAGAAFLRALHSRRPAMDCLIAGCAEIPLLLDWIGDAKASLRDVELLDPVELALAAVDARTRPAETIHEQFERVARRYPDRPAIVTGGDVTTYAALNRAANGIAREIVRRRRAGRVSEPIALLLDADASVVAAMLGVLKAGQFYVPLDPARPEARLRRILADAQAPMLITSRRHGGLAAGLSDLGREVIEIDSLRDEPPDGDLDLAICPDEKAYVLYTSGSTGEPKGVIQTHRYVLHLVDAYDKTGQFCGEDRFALLSSPSFAGAVRDIYCALLRGAMLLPFDVKREGLAALVEWLRRHEITVLFAVATLFRHFAGGLPKGANLPELRRIYIGSETVYTADAALFQHRFADSCLLIVSLGGTELSPVCQFVVTHETALAAGSTVPAGYPIEGHEVLLLGDDGEPVASGEVGEIVVRSRYLSPGYWRRPELTAAAFLPDPHGGDQRLFKTGDLGRSLPDGCLVHLGRKDFQVKIRGHRVELCEIDAALLATGFAGEAAAAAWPDSLGEPRIIAYITRRDPTKPLPLDEIRRRVAATLPEYMVPAAVMELPALPKSANGKLDRRALPAPTRVRGGRGPAPGTSLEVQVASIWEEVLGVASIRADDDFFALGGHSVLASRVLARLPSAFGVSLPLRALFDAPTVAALAARIEIAQSALSARREPLDEEGTL